MSGALFATAGSSIKLWDSQKYTQYQEILSANGHITGITWTQNGQCIASLGETVSEVSLFAVNSKSTANIGVVRAVESPSCLQFPCRSSHYLGVGSKKGDVVLWNLKSKSRKKAFTVTDSNISCITFSHNDSHIAASSKGSIYLLSTMNNSVGGPFKIFDNQAVTEVVYSMVKKSLLGCCSEGGAVSLFDAHASKTIHTFANAHSSPVSSVSFSPINELLMISVGYDKKFACYSIQNKKQILTHKSSAPLTSVAFLPGCQHVALGTMTGQVFIHDLRTIHKPLATINAHDKPVTNILLQPGTKHISEGSSSDVKATNSKLRKKSEMKLSVPSKSSSEMPSQEVAVESVTNSKAEALCMPAVDPSQDVLSAIFSPVRPSEQVATANHEQVEEKVLNYDNIMDNVFSPVRLGGHVPIDDVSSPSSSKPISNTMFVEDIFSPVRTSQNVDAPSNFPDMLSPHCEDEAVSSPEPRQIAKSLSKAASNAEASLPECNSSTQNSKEKENLDPNKVITTPRTSKQDSNRNAESISVENIFPKHILSPLHQVEKLKQNSNSAVIKALKKPGIENPEKNSDSSALDFTNQATSLLATRMVCEDATTAGTDDTTKLSEEPTISPKIYEGIRSGSGASDLQVKLIRSCMAEVLEEFQDDVNRRMMHLQCVVTKQFLQLKETMQHLQHQLVLNNNLAMENELLREENKLMKANF